MAAPTNTTIATATALALAASVTQRVDDAGTTYTVWYKFVAPAGETWVGVLALGDLTVYRPLCSVWLGPEGAPTSYFGIQGRNEPLQFVVTTGTTYYFKIEPNSGNPAPAVLTLSVLHGPQYDVPAGSLAVNDDTEGFPLVFLSATTGAVLSCLPGFPAGEAADILPSGIVAVANGADSQIAVYSAALTLLGTVGHPASGLFGFLRAHGPSGVFYVGNETNGQIRTVTAAGAFGPTTWTTGASGLQSLAVNTAGTRAYYGEATTDLVKQWNLTSNTAAGTFLAYPVAGTEATDILVLSDDTLVINFAKTGETHLRHYSAAGALLHGYDYTGLANPGGTQPRLAMARDEPATVWLWTHHFTPDFSQFGLSRFRQIRLSDGVALVTLDTTEFETGIYQPTPVLDPVRFGHSYSCAFWETRGLREEPDGPAPPDVDEDAPPFVAPSYHLDARYIRRLRRAPHVAQEHTRVFYKKFELDLERGVGLPSGQGSDPLIALRVSRDGGHTWSEPVEMHAGAIGAYSQRVIARRLGHARDAVFEVTVSDPVAWSLVQAWLDLEPGAH